MRAYFRQRDVLEVETPYLSQHAATDPNLRSFAVPTATAGDRFLHTSPEFAMKRLLAAYGQSVFQICRVFRDAEQGQMHNPEFTMLEWYQVGVEYRQLIDEVGELLQLLINPYRPLQPMRLCSYGNAFKEACGLDPTTATVEELTRCAQTHELHIAGHIEADELLDLLLSQVVAPSFVDDRITVIYEFPATQAALSKVDGQPPVAQRFEVFVADIELADGYQELTDPQQQCMRFEADRRQRLHKKLPDLPYDAYLIQALQAGMSDCSGVALGLDRLMMVIIGTRDIDDVLSFDWSSA